MRGCIFAACVFIASALLNIAAFVLVVACRGIVGRGSAMFLDVGFQVAMSIVTTSSRDVRVLALTWLFNTIFVWLLICGLCLLVHVIRGGQDRPPSISLH